MACLRYYSTVPPTSSTRRYFFSLTHTHTGKRAGGWILRLEQTGDDDDDDDDGQQFSKEGREVIKVGLIIGPSS